ncbi:ATP-binding protein [bacterium]|nr:ATP-binding protein [bacterium]
MPKKANPSAATQNAECPKCGGYGIIIGDDGSTERCDCGILGTQTFRLRYEQAQIPQRFARKTLKAFQVPRGDKHRREILNAASSYAQAFTRGEDRGLLLRGSTGAGKTHVAVGILIEVMRRGFSGLYWNVSDLLRSIRGSFSQSAEFSESELLEQVEGVDLLVLDDLGAEHIDPKVLDRLYLIINRRYEIGRATIITTNLDEFELKERFGARIYSRLQEMCETAFPEFPGEDYRFKMMQ